MIFLTIDDHINRIQNHRILHNLKNISSLYNYSTSFSRIRSVLTRFTPEIEQVDKQTRNETKLERRKSQNPAPRLRRSITVQDFQDIQTVAQVMIFNYPLFQPFSLKSGYFSDLQKWNNPTPPIKTLSYNDLQ